MVRQKYLCSAPRPETWEGQAENVRKRLQGPQAQTMLRDTIRSLRQRFPTRVSGPGRKSNAEHAILFYQYVLEQLEEDESEEDEQAENSSESEEEQAEEEEEAEVPDRDAPVPVYKPLKKATMVLEKNLCQVCQESNAADQAEFSCSTCDRVFHVACVRPVLEEAPDPNSYRCAYCVLASEPKHTKPRRTAAAAVRLMARLYNKLQRERKSSGTKHPVAKPPAALAAHSPDEQQDKKDAMEEEDKKPAAVPEGKPKVDATSEDSATKEPPGSEDSARAKRERKPTTLYDPQLCAAGSWRSDELARFQQSLATSSDSDSEGSAGSDSSSDDDKEDEDKVFCEFCQDDKSIEICCFCACRVCFGKAKKSKLLICDACEDEYHTFCLQPPLRSVPTQAWFCPSCAKTQAKRNSKSTTGRIGTRGAATTPSRSASKRKASSSSPSSRPKLQRDSTGKFAPKVVNKDGSIRKRLGRPPKKSTSPPSATKKRRRGSNTKTPGDTAKASKKRKSASPGDDANVTPGTASSGGSVGSLSSTQVKISRSGRPVKRSAFHDELPDSEQHLRTGRMVQEETGAALGRASMADSRPKAAPSAQAFRAAASSSRPTPSHVSVSSALAMTKRPAGKKNAASVMSGAGGATVQATGGPLPPWVLQAAAAPSTLPAMPVASLPAFASLPGTGSAAGSMATAAFNPSSMSSSQAKQPRRKPGARECMQISRRFGSEVIPEKYIEILTDYCTRGKVEHLIRMRERLDEHARFLELQLAGLEALVKEKGESDVRVPPMPLALQQQDGRKQGPF